MSTNPLAELRASESLKAAQRATERDARRKHRTTLTWMRYVAMPQPKRCISCGAQVYSEPTEGEGLPCGH